MRTLVLSLAMTAVLGAGAAFAQSTHFGTSGRVVAQAAAPSPMPSPVSTIHIKNFAYVPDSVTIPAGSVVKFVQDDETPHTVTAADGSFDSGNLNQKQSWTHAFAKAGTYNYFCTYHTYMKAKIIVQ